MQIDARKLYFDPNKLFPNLKKFTWKTFKIKEVELIGPQIASRLQYLDDFGLGFTQDRAQVEITELGQYFGTLETDLNRLTLVYDGTELSGQDAKALIYGLSSKRLQKLNTLSLEFNHCRGVTNGFLTDLAKVCGKNCIGLKCLRLSFGSLFETEFKITSLKKGILGIYGLSDRGIKNFGEILSKNYLQLELVSLGFRKNLQISDKGVKSMCGRLNRLTKLQTVRIRFEGCWHVTEKGCEEAMKSLGAHRQVLVDQWRSKRFSGYFT